MSKVSKLAFPVQDNWGNFNYNLRFLDALAALFHIQGVCAAVLKYEEIFYLSYNSSITNQSKKRLDFITKNILSKPFENLLGIYLIFNPDFKSFIKKDKNHVDGNFKAFLEELISLIQQSLEYIDKNINKIIAEAIVPDQLLGEVGIKYNEILSYRNELNFKAYVDVFLRPLQDCKKLFFYFQHNKYNEIKIISLDNSNNFHAEYNISFHFPKVQLLDINYIGISKLSCGYCHKYLEESGYFHRGTHGVCDDEWYMIGPQNAKFKNSIEAIAEFKQEDLPPQHRKLSIDEFENTSDLIDLFQLKNELLSGTSTQYEEKESFHVSFVGLSNPSAELSRKKEATAFALDAIGLISEVQLDENAVYEYEYYQDLYNIYL